jgi:predicted MFS family arabinose efflux permease
MSQEIPTQVRRFEKLVILVISAVQFVNVLEFMMVMPLGPDFATALGIPLSSLGIIGGSYTAAAAVSGLLASLVVERFARRTALAFAMCGLVLATVAAGLSNSFETLVAARVLAGLFGGPAMSVALAVIADVIPPQRRGKAMGVVMGSFSIASIIGVPAGLELARIGGWRLPFFAIAAMAVVIMLVALTRLPPMREHVERRAEGSGLSPATLRVLLARPVVIEASVMTGVVMMGAFMLIPNLATYVQFNLGYPRERLGLLYLVGGLFSLASMRLTGPLVDKIGAFRVGTAGTLFMLVMLYYSFVDERHLLPAMAIYATFMVSTALRNIPFQTLSSQVPRPNERASYMSIQSSIQHVSGAFGAFIGSQMLTERPDKGLDGVPEMTLVAMAITALLPLLLYLVERNVRAQRTVAV